MKLPEIKSFLEEKHEVYNHPGFIEKDPVSVPHRFSRKEDIEIAGFLTAIISWGNRNSIINNANRLMQMMDETPFDFVTGAGENELRKLGNFVHRTFNGTDCVHFIRSLRNIYLNHGGLEGIFMMASRGRPDIQEGLIHLRHVFFDIPHLTRTEKHVADITRGSSAKRLNMFLRWMIRKDNRGVDFGLWKGLSPSGLFIPLDIHTGNVSRKLGLLKRKQNDWRAVVELTSRLREMDATDPVKYDFALFGLGIFEKF